MKTILRIAALLAATTLALAACASATTKSDEATVIEDTSGFVSALEANGATVTVDGETNYPYFTVAGEQLTVDGAPVQIYGYATETERTDASALISTDGYMINGQVVDWADQPTMWASGKVIVILTGNYPDVSSQITSILGAPFISAQPTE